MLFLHTPYFNKSDDEIMKGFLYRNSYMSSKNDMKLIIILTTIRFYDHINCVDLQPQLNFANSWIRTLQILNCVECTKKNTWYGLHCIMK